MKPENINSENINDVISGNLIDGYRRGNCRADSAVDDGLRVLLRNRLPQANENQWFTRRVMNRLPPQSRWSRISLWQWICYLLGFVGFIGAAYWSGQWMVHTEISFTTILTVGFLSLLAITTAGIIMVPSLVRILREP